MLSRLIAFYFITLIIISPSFGQNEALDLIDLSIKFHDPKNNWVQFDGRLNFTVEMRDQKDGRRKIHINNDKKTFSFWAQYDDGLLQYQVNNDEEIVRWNGSKDISDEIKERRRIKEGRPTMYKNYYTYLYGMPMKLKDAGTIVHPTIEQVDFHGKFYNKIKVTYDPEVGTDTWYFYFDIKTNALEAYQFSKDETKNDGEYILFEDLKVIDHIKIPRIRKWYYNKDEKFLATDILE